MKKRARAKSKKSAAAPSQAQNAAQQDVIVLLSTLVEKLTSFENKLNIVLSRLPAEKALPQPMPQPEQRRDFRPMYKVICADCGKDSEVPFKPSDGRPVYCKECFTARKRDNTLKPSPPAKPAEPTPAPQPKKPEKKPSKPASSKKTKKKKKKSGK